MHVPIRILAFVGPGQVPRLRAYSVGDDITVANSWSGVEATLQQAAFDVLVIDPLADSVNGEPTRRAARALRQLDRMPTVVYGTPEALPAWRRVSPRDDVHVVVSGSEDAPDGIERAIHHAYQSSAQHEVLARLDTLPPPLDVVIPALVRDARHFRAVEDLVEYSGRSRRGVYRACALTVVGTPLGFLRVGWSFFAYRLMALQGAPFKAAALQLGDTSGRRLRAAIEAVFGCRPTELGAVSVDDVVERIVALLTGRPSGAVSSQARTAAETTADSPR